MKLPLNIVRKYTTLDLDDSTVEHMLATKVGEVESVTNWSEAYEGIYIAQVTSKSGHPDAEKLGIYQVNTGTEQVQVVAGDKGLEVGDKVAYIKPGNIVPSTYNTSEEFKIKAVNMRGVLSNGMLCSEKELNLGPDHSKVLKLPSDASIGELFSHYYELDDTVMEIENKALTNRGDLFGILGLARELSAAQGIPFTSPDWYRQKSLDLSPEGNILPLEIKNETENICSRYVGITIDNISIQQSPIWLKSVLLKTGIKPINNVVDITNYLMVLTGQPLHAFDYDKLLKNDPNTNETAHITVRLAKDGERIHTLDNKVVELNSNTLVIADSTNPIALAGMIGGIDTEIDSDTKRIVIESANFDRFNVRRSSMAYGITTDAVTRFTRAQDPNQCLPVLGKAVELIKELAGGSVASNVIDIYPFPSESNIITLSITKINSHLGTNLIREDVVSILRNIEYGILPEETEDFLTVVPPTFRKDILIAEDIHEDIGRIYGYENIKPTLPLRETKAANLNSNIEIKSRIRIILSNSGANEIDTYSFVGQTLIEKANQDVNLAYHIKNALSPDLEFMRPSLLVSILEKAQQNIGRNIPEFCMYEFNIPHQKGYIDKFELPAEAWHLSLLFTTKNNNIEGNPYYQGKRYFEKVVSTLGITNLEYELVADTSDLELPIWIKNLIPTFTRNSSAVVFQYEGEKKKYVGVIGDINSSVKSNFRLPTFTCAFEINLEVLKKLNTDIKKYKETSKYPSITQDMSFTVKSTTTYKDIKEIIERVLENRKTNVKVECIDIYKESIDSESKNITVRITVEHMEKTLTAKEIEKSKRIIEQSIQKL